MYPNTTFCNITTDRVNKGRKEGRKEGAREGGREERDRQERRQERRKEREKERRKGGGRKEARKKGGRREGAGVAQLVSAQPSELKVPGSILGDSNVCFYFLLICEALALNTRKTEH